MEKMLDVQEILESMRQDEQQLERLIDDLKKEEESSAFIINLPSRES
jgi:vacuolar-type H+-ATPase subunit H